MWYCVSFLRINFFFQGALSSSTVGSIVGLQSEEISQIASEYAERVSTEYVGIFCPKCCCIFTRLLWAYLQLIFQREPQK